MDTIGDESFVNLDAEIDLVDGQGVGNDEFSSESLVQQQQESLSSERLVQQAENRDVVDECYKNIRQLTTDDIWGLEFGSELEACEFYQTYAKCHGFVMRKDEVGRDFNGQIVMRQLVCNKQGLRHKKHLTRVDRKRDPKPITRTNCPARIRVHLDYKISKWKVVSFEETHNHELYPAEFVHLIPTYHVMTDVDKAQVETVTLHGVRTCHILGFMLGQKDSYDGLGFCKKDLYNHLDRSRLVMVEDGDAFAALSYLQGKADNDPMLYAKFTTLEDGKLQHLFWSDGCSRIDFQCFGDVLVFDSTYKKNKYNQPLLIFTGCNHHGDTTIFGCALIADEKVETYKWVLETFLEAMFNKHPKSVVTDGDDAVREAINIVFPNIPHRLCGWHLQNIASENIKDATFLEDFKEAIYSDFNEEQFEEFWKNMIEKHGIYENNWIDKIYETRGMWATAYLRDKFFCGIKTASQCNGINSFIKRYVEKKNSLVDFMSNFERGLKEYRHNEWIEDFKTIYSEPAMTTSLYEMEVEASKIFTRKMFKEVKKEIEGVGALNVIEQSESESKLKFKMNIFGSPRSVYEVLFDKDECKFLCDCRLFQSRGIPCSHIFCAMKYQHMTYIPSSLVCKRWTKDAKKDYISLIASKQRDASQKITTLRFGALSAACNRLCHLAARNFDDFSHIRAEIFKLIVELEKQHDSDSNQSTSTKDDSDSTMIKTKGTRSKRKNRKSRRCSNNKRIGHTIQKCSPQVMMDVDVKNLSSCSESDKDTREIANDVEVKGTCSSKRKHGKVTISTQASVKESKQKQQQVHVVQNAHSNTFMNHQSRMNNNMVTRGCFNLRGSGVNVSADSTVVPIYPSSGVRPPTQGQPIFSPYIGGAVYPQIPMYPPNPSLGFYPQYFGGYENIHGAYTWNPDDPRIKK